MAKKATGARKTAATPEPEKAPEQITPLGEETAQEETPEPEKAPEVAKPAKSVEVPGPGSPINAFYGLWRVIEGRVLHFLHDPATPHEWAPGGRVVNADSDFLAEQIMRQLSKLKRVVELPDGEEIVPVRRNDVLSLAASYKSTPVDGALSRKAPPAPLI